MLKFFFMVKFFSKTLLFFFILFFVLFFLSSCSDSCSNPLKCSIQSTLEKVGIHTNISGEEKANITITPYLNENNNNNNNNNINNDACNLIEETVSYKSCVDVNSIIDCKTITKNITYCEGERPNIVDECQTKTDCI